MSTPTRIYVVRDNEMGEAALVRAANPAQAIRHVVKNRFAVVVADQEALVRLLADGVEVETAGADTAADPTEPLPLENPA